MREWGVKFPEESKDEKKDTREVEHVKYQHNIDQRSEDSEETGQKAPKGPSISSDTSPLWPVPASSHKSDSTETTQQQQVKKQVNFNEFENGLAPPDPWDPPITLKEELQELREGALELVTKTTENDDIVSSIDNKELPGLDASMESVGIEAAKLASLHFPNAHSETVIQKT